MIVIRYGILHPTLNADIVREQLRLAHRYRNTLIEIERGRRAAVRELYSSVGDMAALEEAARTATAAAAEVARRVKLHKSAGRTGKVPEELRQELDQARIVKRNATQAWSELRKASRTEAVQLELDRINELAKQLTHSARAHCGLYWGTYLLVEDAMDASAKSPLWGVWQGKVWCPLLPNDPSFLRWTGEGQIGVQLQGGLPTSLAFSEDRRFQLVRVPDKLGRGKRCFATLRLRVGSDENLAPIWAEFPLKIHRPLPEGQIKRVSVKLRMIGPREEWSVHVVIDNQPIVRACGSGVVGVNLGWRLLGVDGGIRVAYAVDEEGETHELVLSESMLSSLQKASELKSIREKRFNDAKAQLSAWLKEHTVPEWLSAKTKTMYAWESMGRLASVALQWRKNRFDGDAEAYDALERWRYRDHHLWTWESDQRVKSLRHRRDIYRVWAARLADRYHTIAFHEHDLSKMARRSFDPDNDAARANRHLVAPSELRLSLINAKRSRDGATVQVALDTHTQTCHACRQLDPFDAAAELEHTCSHCGAHWDQDANNARNVLREYLEHPGDAKIVGTARKLEITNENGEVKETKRERVARLLAEKLARNEAARKSASNLSESMAE